MRPLKVGAALLSVFMSIAAYSQSSPTSTTVDLVERTPASPNAGSLGKYFDFPVNLATGLPTISIPLYTIQVGRITIPISLRYNAGGVKVTERASWVGTNWSLDAGGSINKRVNGYDDLYGTNSSPNGTSGPQYNYINPDYSAFISNFSTITDIIDSANSNWINTNGETLKRFLGRIANGLVDGEADEYFFSTPETGGTFFYDQRESKFINNKPDGTSILFNYFSSDSTFVIKTKNGLLYHFGLKEYIVNPIFKKGMGSAMKYLTNAFYLTTVSDPKTGKSVTFNYDNNYSDVVTGQSMWVDYKFVGANPYYNGADNTDIEREGDEYSVNAIYFGEGKALFIKDTANRLDGGTKALREIQVYNIRNVLLKRIKLDYFYLTSDTSTRCTTPYNRLFLSSIRETEFNGTGDSLVKEPYVFTYKNDVKLPCAYSYAFDHWGFYNGKTTNTTTIPTIYALTLLGIPTQSNRNVDTAYTQCGVLKSIQYPTGGTTNFEYENNRTDTLVGGLRIKRITQVDSVASKNIVKEFEYKDASGVNSGQILQMPVQYYQYQYESGAASDVIYRIEGDAINPLFPNQGSPVLYTSILEKVTGGEGDFRTRHHMTGFYSYANENYINMCCGVPHNKYGIRSDLIGIEYKTETYKYDNGVYSLLRVDSSVIDGITNEDQYAWNAQVAWAMVMDGWIVWPGNDPYSTNPMNLNTSLNAYKLIRQTLAKKESYAKQYEKGGMIETGVKFEYDQDNTSVKESRTVDSKGDTTITSIKYTGDYIYLPGASTGQNFQLKMLWDSWMKTEPVETIVRVKKKDSTNSTVVSAVLYEYEGLNISKVFKLYDKIPYGSFNLSYNDSSGFYKDSRYKLYQEITAWDSIVKPKTVVTNSNMSSYIWDVYFDGPMAIVANASYEDIAYAGFEGFANGGWTGAGSARDSVYSITGRRSYQLSSGSLTRSGLSTGKTYIVSYWSRNGNYTVSGSTGTVQGRTLNGWTYYEHTVTGVSSITVSGSGTSYIDELRLYPKDAQMQTYAYEELLGVKSICDAASRISYFDYWGPGYLKTVKDEEGNILKRVEYKYKAGNTE
ncbi:MAG: hypothetical protein U0U70_01815 [Chitinophagaceae bacterium]